MTTLRGRIRNQATLEFAGSDPSNDQATIRAQLVAQIDEESWELIDVKTAVTKPELTLTAVARSRESREIVVEGRDYAEARAAYLEQIPEGWVSLGTLIDD